MIFNFTLIPTKHHKKKKKEHLKKKNLRIFGHF